LRPPSGYRFDRAVSTTFSLDLMALLTMPVAFTFFDRQSDDGRPAPDPLAMLQALRRYADRIHVFCHAGQIAAPRRHHQLFAYLESSVFGVLPPSEHGVFHPKLTVLRFVEGEQENDGAPEPAVRYRVLCASRNLTFDRSW